MNSRLADFLTFSLKIKHYSWIKEWKLIRFQNIELEASKNTILDLLTQTFHLLFNHFLHMLMTDHNFAFSAFGFDITVVSHWIIPTEFHPVLFDIYKLTFSKVTILQHCCQAGWQLWGISIFLVSFFLHFFATPIWYTKYIDIRRNVKDKVGQKYLLRKFPCSV